MSAQDNYSDSNSSSPTYSESVIRKIDKHNGFPGADIVLKSSDDFYFPTFKLLLSMVSDVFRDMLILPQPETNLSSPATQPAKSPSPTSETLDGLPVVAMPETRLVIETILIICHPGKGLSNSESEDDLNNRNLEDAFALTTAFHKYEMHAASSAFREVIKDRYLKDTSDAITCFCFAWSHGLVDEVRMAARSLLPVSIEKRPSVPFMKEISALDFYKLQEHYIKCWAAVDNILENDEWRIPIDNDQDVCWLNCTACPRIRPQYHAYDLVCKWFHTFTNEMKDAIRGRQPLDTIWDSAFTAQAFVTINKECRDPNDKVAKCRRQARRQLKVFVNKFIRDMNKIFQEVENDIFSELL